MMMPSIFGESLFDDGMDFPFEREFKNPFIGKHEKNLMKTDIKEKDGNYILDMDLPGYKKEDVQAQLDNGYLTISASRGNTMDQKDDKGNYIRKERFLGECSRSFYVGDEIKQEDIKASFADGILHIIIPKVEPNEKVENKKCIAIE